MKTGTSFVCPAPRATCLMRRAYRRGPERNAESQQHADCSSSSAASFEHLVGTGEEGWRVRNAERAACLQVDNEIVFGRVFYRNLSGRMPLSTLPTLTSRGELFSKARAAWPLYHDRTTWSP